MIMRPGQELLLPANPLFVWASLLLALMVNMLPLGRLPWMPDVLALALVFWAVHQPRWIGVGAGFVLGLAMDVQQAALLGQHALSYAVLGFLGVMVHRRLLWFGLGAQSLQLMPLFLASQVLELTVRLIGGGMFPGWSFLLAPLLQGALWPVVSLLLLLPQRRAPNPDENRPL